MPGFHRRRRSWLWLVPIVVAGCGGAPEQEPVAGHDAASVCREQADTVRQIECYVDLATREGHPRACRELDDDDVRYPCFAVLAERLREASLCDDIPASNDETRQLRDGCLRDVAAVLEQSTLCERILTSDLRDGCFHEIAGRTGDAALCASIADGGLKNACTEDTTAYE